MILTSITLELRILRTLTNSNKKNLAKLIKVINSNSFEAKISKEIYNRIITLAKQRGILISWDELQVDPALSETTRKKILKYKKKPIRDVDKLNRSIEQLQNYAKLRSIYRTTEYLLSSMKAEKIVDPNLIAENAINQLNTGKLNFNHNNEFTDIGTNDKSARKIIRNLLKYNSNSYIPTGLREFDERNRGIPRGTFFTVLSSSGGGKSVMANQLCSNAASLGFRTCLVPLEMTSEENLKRHVANKTNIEMGKIINPKRLSNKEYKNIIKYWLRYNRKIRKSGGLLRIYVPKEDVTMEETLFILQPFNFDLIIVDYIGLLKGTDGEDQVRKLGSASRVAKIFADKNNMCVGACAQLTDDNKAKYARAITEHSGLAFSWQYDKKSKESHIIQVELPKARNQDSRPFYLKENFPYMRFEDINSDEVAEIKEKESGEITSSTNNKTNKKQQEQKEQNHKIVSEADFFTS